MSRFFKPVAPDRSYEVAIAGMDGYESTLRVFPGTPSLSDNHFDYADVERKLARIDARKAREAMAS